MENCHNGKCLTNKVQHVPNYGIMKYSAFLAKTTTNKLILINISAEVMVVPWL